MSVIVHRCDCGHTDMSHAESHGKCSFGYCKCGKIRSQIGGPSELLPTYGDGFVLVATIVKPGEIFGSTLDGVTKSCACSSCTALFAEQAAS